MDRRTFITGIAGGILAAPLAADAQQAGKVYRIGFLGLNAPSAAPHHIHAFQHGLRELGWIEGKNVAIEYRWAEGKPERTSMLARELVRLNVDVIVTSGAPALWGVGNLLTVIAHVFVIIRLIRLVTLGASVFAPMWSIAEGLYLLKLSRAAAVPDVRADELIQ